MRNLYLEVRGLSHGMSVGKYLSLNVGKEVYITLHDKIVKKGVISMIGGLGFCVVSEDGKEYGVRDIYSVRHYLSVMEFELVISLGVERFLVLHNRDELESLRETMYKQQSR